MSQQPFYNKISQVSAGELIDFLDHNQTEIIIKILKQYIKTNISAKKSEKNLSIKKFSTFEFSNEPVICSFQVKEELYFFKSYLTDTTTDYVIEIPEEIFQLQRRSDYRVAMPLGVTYKCEVKTHNGLPKNIKVEIRDISLGGCQVSLTGKHSEIKKEDQLDLFFQLDRFEFPVMTIVAKHVKIIENQNNTLIGASYFDPDGPFLSELQALIMHLDRIHRGKSYE